MKFAIAIHGAPYASFAHQRGLQLAQTILAEGHELTRIFFYHEAVTVALNSTVPPQGEVDITSQWQAFHQQHNIELAVCIANALKRGVLSTEEQQRYEKSSGTLSAGFELVGLGQLIDAASEADRYVEIPA